MKKVYQMISGVLALSMFCTAFTGCSESQKKDSTNITEQPVAILTSETAQTGEEDNMEMPQVKHITETLPQETEHISPKETVTSVLGTQVDVDVVLNRDSVEGLRIDVLVVDGCRLRSDDQVLVEVQGLECCIVNIHAQVCNEAD